MFEMNKISLRYNSFLYYFSLTSVLVSIALILNFINFPWFFPFLRLEFSNVSTLMPFAIFPLEIALLMSCSVGIMKNILYFGLNYGAGGLPGHLFEILMTFFLSLFVYAFLKTKLLNFNSKYIIKNKVFLFTNLISLLFIVLILSIIALGLNDLIFLKWYLNHTFNFSKLWYFIFSFNIVLYSTVLLIFYSLIYVDWRKRLRL